MKLPPAGAVLFMLSATAALAGEAVVRLDDPGLYLEAGLGKQVNVRFSDVFAKGRLSAIDYDGVVISELPVGKVCLFGRPQGIEPSDPELKDVGRNQQGDICISRADVAVRVATQDAPGRPQVPFYQTDKAKCAWVWTKGKDTGLWTEDCRFETGRWTVSYDEAGDWFALRVDDGAPFPVVRPFRLAAGEDMDALLSGLKHEGLVLDDVECRFAPYTERIAPPGWMLWEVIPTGKRKQAFDSEPKDEIPDPPCGELGMTVDGIGFFAVRQDHPDRVVYFNLGQDGTMTDPFSITFD